jgi:glycosyltransferase involved in cell wall biosynthesis
MKILHISKGIYPIDQAATEIYTTDLAEALIRRGMEITVAIPGSSKVSQTAKAGLLPNYVVPPELAPKGRFGNKLRYATFRGPLWKDGLSRLVRRTRPDVIHLQHAKGFGISLLNVLEGFRLPIVITLPDYWLLCPGILRDCDGDIARCAAFCCNDLGWQSGTYLTRLAAAKRQRRQAKGFIRRVRPPLAAISDRTRSIFVSEGVDEQLIEVHPWGIDVRRFREAAQRLGEHSGSVRIGFLRSMRSHKGCHVLAEAFLQAQPLDATLHLHGGGDGIYIESLKRQFDTPKITFRGPFDHGSVADILGSLDVVVIPSIWEETWRRHGGDILPGRARGSGSSQDHHRIQHRRSFEDGPWGEQSPGSTGRSCRIESSTLGGRTGG